jgi:hypothetical protein
VSIVQKIIRPFAEQGHYTAVHDAIFDVIMPICPPNAYKVLLFIIRKTRGWEKDSDRLSVGQIQRGTGISSENTARAALAWLLEQRMILKVDGYSAPDHVAYEYALNAKHEITLPEGDTSRKNRGRGPSNIEVGATAKSDIGAGSEIEGHNNHPTQEPSVKNNDGSRIVRSLPDETNRRPTEREYCERVEAWLASDPLGDELAKLMERVSSRNGSGRMTWARKWNGHIAKVEEWRGRHPEAAVRYALEETNRREKSDIRYAAGVLRNNPEDPPARNGSAPRGPRGTASGASLAGSGSARRSSEWFTKGYEHLFIRGEEERVELIDEVLRAEEGAI